MVPKGIKVRHKIKTMELANETHKKIGGSQTGSFMELQMNFLITVPNDWSYIWMHKRLKYGDSASLCYHFVFTLFFYFF
jgi:hypothetical protein